MAAGLQCWDASGNLVLDGTSRMLHEHLSGTRSVTFTLSSFYLATISVPGVSAADTLAIAWYTSASVVYQLGVSVGTDVLYLRRGYGYTGTFTVNFETYKF